MLTATHISFHLVHALPALAVCGWAAARRGDRIVVAIDATLPPRRIAVAMLEALTDDEYTEYEARLPLAEQQRRLTVTWEWRHLGRRRAMLAHFNQFTDTEYEQYELGLPLAELERRRRFRARGLYVAGPGYPREVVLV